MVFCPDGGTRYRADWGVYRLLQDVQEVGGCEIEVLRVAELGEDGGAVEGA